MSGRSLLTLKLFIQIIILIVAHSVLRSSHPILKASRFQTLSTLGVKQVWGYTSLAYAFAAIAIIAAFNILGTLFGEDIVDHDPEHTSLN